jgi:hypothetical protein
VVQNSNLESEEHVEVAFIEVYRVHPSLPLQKHRIGNWSTVTGPTWTSVPFCKRRSDLQGTTIKATLVDDASILILLYITTLYMVLNYKIINR